MITSDGKSEPHRCECMNVALFVYFDRGLPDDNNWFVKRSSRLLYGYVLHLQHKTV